MKLVNEDTKLHSCAALARRRGGGFRDPSRRSYLAPVARKMFTDRSAYSTGLAEGKDSASGGLDAHRRLIIQARPDLRLGCMTPESACATYRVAVTDGDPPQANLDATRALRLERP